MGLKEVPDETEKEMKQVTDLELKRERRFYKANEKPPFALALLFGFQVYFMNINNMTD